MSKPNGRTQKAIEGLAAALTECFEAATESAANRVKDEVKGGIMEEITPRLDRQDATLRMIWTQCGGRQDERLPIDN